MRTQAKHTCLMVAMLFSSWAQAQYVPSQTIFLNVDTIHVRADGQSYKTIENMIRIDTPQGVKEDGERRISFNEKLETLEILEAYTVQPNGERVVVTPDKIRKLDGENLDAYSDSKVMVMIFPKVEVGSQLYYKAKSHQHTPEFPGHFFWSEYFSPHYRYEHAEFVLTHDEDVKLSVDAVGILGGRVAALPSDAPGVVRYRYVFKQDQAFPTEPAQVEMSDFAPHLAFSTFANYADFAQAYQSRAKPMAAVTPAIAALAQQLVAGVPDERAKARKLAHWVSASIRYVAEYVGAGGFIPHSAHSVLSNRYGDCKDHVVLLEALLAAVGIDSSPALINAGSSFTLPKLPISIPFDHVITYIPKFDLYLDSTSPYAPFGTLPEGDMGKPVLLTATGEIGQTPKQSPVNDFTVTESNLTVHGDGKVSGTSIATMRGSFEVGSRSAHFSYKNQDQLDVVNSFLKRFQETGVGEFLKNEPSNLETPWTVASTFELDPVVNVPGPSAMTIPQGVTSSRLKGMSTLKTPLARRFPAGCTSARHTESTKLNFPSNINIERIPANIRFQQGAIDYQASYSKDGQQVSVHRVYSAVRKQPFCDAKDDHDWNAFRMVLQRDLRAQVFFK